MHSRGSGFFDFSYTTLTLGLLITVLLFFSCPSKAAQVTCLVVAVVLLVDSIIIVAVSKIRYEEGWVGIASVVWALLISIWVITVDVSDPENSSTISPEMGILNNSLILFTETRSMG